MNPFCIYCGSRLVMDIHMDRGECPTCGEVRDTEAMVLEDTPKLLHGITCSTCDGEGFIFQDTYTTHPYGDTYATEVTREAEDCDECDTKGAHLDDESCIVCGLPVKAGWNLYGWEVHEGCHDENEETPEPGPWD